MRIALITHDIVKTDGQGRVNYELAHYLSQQGHNIHLYANRVDQSLLDAPHVSVHHIPVLDLTNLIKGVSFALIVCLVLRRNKFDIIHNNGDAAFAASDVNTCHFCHSSAPREMTLQRSFSKSLYLKLYREFHAFMERFAYRRSRMVIAVSRQIAKELVTTTGTSLHKIAVVYNGVDSDEYEPRSLRPAPHEEKEKVKELRLLFVGDLSSTRKGLDTILEALRHLPEYVTLSVVGRTANSTYPQVVAANPMLRQRVHFWGFRSDMPAIYRAHDLFIFPSHYDPFGLVVLEAMSAGLAVIVSAHAGASELIEHLVNGYILQDPNDAATLAEYVKRLHDDEPSRDRLCEQARKDAVLQSWQQMARQIELVYERIHSDRNATSAVSQ